MPWGLKLQVCATIPGYWSSVYQTQGLCMLGKHSTNVWASVRTWVHACTHTHARLFKLSDKMFKGIISGTGFSGEQLNFFLGLFTWALPLPDSFHVGFRTLGLLRGDLWAGLKSQWWELSLLISRQARSLVSSLHLHSSLLFCPTPLFFAKYQHSMCAFLCVHLCSCMGIAVCMCVGAYSMYVHLCVCVCLHVCRCMSMRLCVYICACI